MNARERREREREREREGGGINRGRITVFVITTWQVLIITSRPIINQYAMLLLFFLFLISRLGEPQEMLELALRF